MHTITVSIQGDVSVAESVQVEDAEALPLFIQLKTILRSEETSKPTRRRGRPRKERPAAEETAQDSPVEDGEVAAEPMES